MGFTGLRYLEYNCNGVDFMESIEMIFNNALELLENEDYKKCKEYLKEMKEDASIRMISRMVENQIRKKT